MLDKPHVVTPDSPHLNSSGEIANKRFLLDPARIGTTGFPTGTSGAPVGWPGLLSAFGLLTLPPGSRNIRIEGCAFDYLPSEAIYFYGCVGVEIEDAWSRNCTQIVRADCMGVPCNRLIRLNRLHHSDGWGGANLATDPDFASVYATGRAIGTNAVSGFFANSEISNLTTSGEVKSALKLVNPVRVALDRIYTSRFVIQGTIYWNLTDDPAQGNGKLGAYNRPGFDERLGDHAADVMITRSRFRPGQSAWYPGRLGNKVQPSYHQENIRFRDCVFYKPDQSVDKHQGIQAWDGVEVDVRNCLFVGWQKPADPLRPFPKQTIVRIGTYQKPGSPPASINADFSRVNEFDPRARGG